MSNQESWVKVPAWATEGTEEAKRYLAYLQCAFVTNTQAQVPLFLLKIYSMIK